MIPPSDELRNLWQSDSPGGGGNQPELLRRLEERARDFDRVVRRRNVREAAAGVLVAAIFLWLAAREGSTLHRIADIWLAACGLCVALFIHFYSKASRNPAPDQTLTSYRQGLIERYDRQIRLLQSAKYWYVLPFWAGLMASAVAYLNQDGGRLRFVLLAIWATAVSVVIWRLNETAGVRHLRRKREELISLFGEGESK